MLVQSMLVDRDRRSRRSAARGATVALGALAIALAGPVAPASAHVTITPSTTAAGARADLAVGFDHGCDGSATTSITVLLPGEVSDVRASGSDRWEVEVGAEAVVYRAVVPIPAGPRDALELSVRLPETPGAVLAFPTVQACEQGEIAWTETPAEGQDPEELILPAPTVVVAGSAPEVLATASSDIRSEGGADDAPVGWLAALGVAVLAALAAIAWVRRRT